MKKFFGFLFIVLLIILIIFFSNRYYSKKEKASNLIEAGKEKVDVIKHKKVDLDEVDSSDTKKKDSEENTEVVKVEEKDDTTTETNSNTNTNTNSNSAVVPNTASDDEDGYVRVESYEVLLNKDSIRVGESTRVNVKVKPQNASEKDVTYLSKTPNVCSVSAMGKVKGLNSGDCLVFINVKNASSHKLLIRVN